MPMTVKTSVEFMPEISELAAVQAAVETVSEQGDWPPALAYQVELILEELCINVIKHGEVDGTKPIKVDIVSDNARIRIKILDNGKAFDPTQDAPEPEQITDIDEAEIGGWGVHLAHTFSDEMHYRRENDMNCLTLVKRRNH